eukprot:SAG11_NODE_946_length_6417_cov_2.052865_2_plen_126_part_00
MIPLILHACVYADPGIPGSRADLLTFATKHHLWPPAQHPARKIAKCAAGAGPKFLSQKSCCVSDWRENSRIMGLSRNKALLWSVPLGKGQIIATGLLDAKNATMEPYAEQAWVLDRLLRHAASLI